MSLLRKLWPRRILDHHLSDMNHTTRCQKWYKTDAFWTATYHEMLALNLLHRIKKNSNLKISTLIRYSLCLFQENVYLKCHEHSYEFFLKMFQAFHVYFQIKSMRKILQSKWSNHWVVSQAMFDFDYSDFTKNFEKTLL